MKNRQHASFGRELYWAIWEKIDTHFYDVSKLAQWISWKHRFDDLIVDDESALGFARQMVASLNDKYTGLVEPDDVMTKRAIQQISEGAVFTERLAGNIGQISILSFEPNNIVNQVEMGLNAIADCDGFLFKLLNNGGGLIQETSECLEMFMVEGPVTTIEFRTERGTTTREIELVPDAYMLSTTETGSEEEPRFFKRRKAIVANKPMSIAINGGSASSTEIVVAALMKNSRKSRLCRTFGKKTLGKGNMQTTFDILNGRATLRITCGRFLSADGVWFGDAQKDCRGIDPDVLVEGGDAAIHEAALEDLRQRLRNRAA